MAKDESLKDPDINEELSSVTSEPAKYFGGFSSTVAMRVIDPFGIVVPTDSNGNVRLHERGEVINVSADLAKQLYKEGKAAPEEMRPEGGPVFVEKR